MTGIERLREMGREYFSCSRERPTIDVMPYGVSVLLADIADQIEREQDEMVADSPYDAILPEDRDAIAWVREHGGLKAVKAHWSGRVALSHVHNMAERHKAKVARMQRHIEHVQGVCKTRAHRIVELNRAVAEMRPRLMPEGMEWPTVDGEPVDFVTGYEPSLGVLEAVSIYSNGACEVMGHDGIIKYVKEIHVATPKVLDADGVEIREKCDVWWICEGDERGLHAERLRVETILPDGLVECSPYNGGTWVSLEPSELYVNKPVPASDGRPLREGETVWHVKTGREYVVVEPSYGKTVVVRLAKYDDAEGEQHAPDKLTHERPDSWERWREEWQWPPVKYCKLVLGVEYDHDTQLDEAFDAQGDDLVRRAKALAGGA